MGKEFVQYRLDTIKDVDDNNNKIISVPSGNIITSVGIQSLPGLKFYFNENLSDENAIILGSTGIFEFENNSQELSINSISFDLSNLRDNPFAYLIVDVIYEEEVQTNGRI